LYVGHPGQWEGERRKKESPVQASCSSEQEIMRKQPLLGAWHEHVTVLFLKGTFFHSYIT
jgi:hypothetical protein